MHHQLLKITTLMPNLLRNMLLIQTSLQRLSPRSGMNQILHMIWMTTSTPLVRWNLNLQLETVILKTINHSYKISFLTQEITMSLGTQSPV